MDLCLFCIGDAIWFLIALVNTYVHLSLVHVFACKFVTHICSLLIFSFGFCLMFFQDLLLLSLDLDQSKIVVLTCSQDSHVLLL